ncbi:MAG: hypothetical protein LBI10_06145 [Deltaproteobacteria bacterium]|nr:hypothetical protein [Deltaproteobacteria bacterium]
MNENNPLEKFMGRCLNSIFPVLLVDSQRGIYSLPILAEEYEDILILLGVADESINDLKAFNDLEDIEQGNVLSELERARYEFGGRSYFILFSCCDIYLAHDGLNLDDYE